MADVTPRDWRLKTHTSEVRIEGASQEMADAIATLERAVSVLTARVEQLIASHKQHEADIGELHAICRALDARISSISLVDRRVA